MGRQMLMVLNPHAGKGKARDYLLDMKDLFARNGYHVTVYLTKSKQDTIITVMDAAEYYDVLICCGGDGTLNEVVTGLMGARRRPRLGYIPLGTTNDFASALHIPRNHMQAAQAVVSGFPVAFDVGSLNGHYFNYIAAFGAFTEVSYTTPQEAKNALGKLAYFLQGVTRLSSIQSQLVKVESGLVRFQEELIFGAITNSTSVAGFQSYRPEDISYHDGVFEALFVKQPKSFMELQALILALTKRDFKSQHFISFKTSHVKVIAQEPFSWTVDGEYGGDYMAADIRNHPSAIEYLLSDTLPERKRISI